MFQYFTFLPISQMSIDTQNDPKEKISQEQQNGENLIKSIETVATTETDTDKAKNITELAPKVLKLFPHFKNQPKLEDLLLTNPQTGRNSFQETLAQLKSKQAKQFNELLNPNHPKHLQMK